MTFPSSSPSFFPGKAESRLLLPPGDTDQASVGSRGPDTQRTVALPCHRQPADDSAFQLPPDASRQLPPPLAPDAPNAGIIMRFNTRRAEARDVLAATGRLMRNHATDWPLAQAGLEALKSARNPLTGAGIQPDISLFKVAMTTCDKWGLTDEAVRWFNDMPARGITPDLECYLIAMQCCRHGGRPDLVIGLLQHLLDHGPRRGVMPTIELVNLALAACEKSGRIDDVMGLFEYVVEHGPALGLEPDVSTFNTVIMACSKTGRQADARRIFDGMRDPHARRCIVPDVQTYNALLFSCPMADLSELLAMAVGQGLVRPSMGFDATRNRLNLHNIAVLQEHRRIGDPHNCVHPELARAIFYRLLQKGLIDVNTRFVLGVQGSDKVRQAIAQCIREQGWTPCHPIVAPTRDVEDFGMLTSVDPKNLNRPSDLNPAAETFQPTGAVAMAVLPTARNFRSPPSAGYPFPAFPNPAPGR